MAHWHEWPEWPGLQAFQGWIEGGPASLGEDFSLTSTRDIPLLGVVAAGQPYRAFPVEDTLAIPTTLWAGRRVFALRVQGSSMIDEGIHPGDHLIVEPRSSAENGQTVVAEIDGAVTVKIFHRQADGSVRLQPANPEMLPLTVRADSVGGLRIIGVVVGVLRRLGFAQKRPRAVAPELVSTPPVAAPAPAARQRAAMGSRPRPPGDLQSLDLALNAIDAQLSRWDAAVARAERDRRTRHHAAQMAELGRDLRALREWCSRSTKPGLHRALIEEANRVMRRMHRFAGVAAVPLPDLVAH